MKKLLLIFFLLSSFNSTGTIQQIQVWNGYYQFLPPNNITIQLGDTIQWIPLDPPTMSHTITSDNIPVGAVPFNQIWQLPADTFFQYIPQVIGLYQYVCTPHIVFGMIGEFNVVNATGVFGCTDLVACNYDSTATIDDGSCVYLVIWQQSFSICNGDSVLVGSSVYNTAGNYTDTLTTVNGCDSIVYTGISVSFSPAVNITTSAYNGYNISCFGAADGLIEINITGGSPPYTFAWNNGQFSPLITGLSGGTYLVDIIDVNNCLEQFAFSLTEPTILSATLTFTDETAALNDGSANAIVLGGVSPYSYNWSNGITTNPNLNLAPGLYTVDVIDANGCIVSTSFPIQAYTPTDIIDIENTSKKLIETTDMLGQETPLRRNTPLFYIYDDGTVEKRIVIE